MIMAANMAGGKDQKADMAWLIADNGGFDERLSVDMATPYVVLVPGCSKAKPQKRWPAENFAAVANDFLKRRLTVFVVGTEEDCEAVDCVLEAAPDIINLCGKTSLQF